MGYHDILLCLHTVECLDQIKSIYILKHLSVLHIENL